MASPPTDLPRTRAERPSAAGAVPRTETRVEGEAPSVLAARQIEEMTAAWRRGERPRADEFFARLPALRDVDAVQLIYEEVCLRQEEGEDPESLAGELLGRYPQWHSKLALLLDCHGLLGSPGEMEFPEVGDELGDVRLLAELGRGGHGRTFLASQGSLAHRLLVLKIAPLGHDEHLSLARLQHMHIVPLYFERVLPDRHLRVLGMPYLGGTTLDRILEAVRGVPVAERTGRHILDALDRCEAARGIATEYLTNGPFRRYLAQASYVQAICWVGACQAEALHYAHERGLIHMDVKTSNVLIAGDGQPMLLDFHLAHGPVAAGLHTTDRLGGTPGFVSPEQHDAMTAIRRGEAVAVAVDGRSDIFSLGLLLYEALGGDAGPVCASRRRPLEACNPRVSPGLSDIIRKCLARDPAGRYPTAALLGQDLTRHLNNQPLQGVANRNLVERWRKWRRRQPAALGSAGFRLAAVAAFLAVLAVSVVHQRQTRQDAETALDEGREHLRNRRYHEATLALNRGLRLSGYLLDGDRQIQTLNATLRRVLREQAATELHDLVNLLRFRFGLNPPSDEEARSLFLRGREVWKRRALLASTEAAAAGQENGWQVRTDLLDLATILAELCVQGAPPGRVDEAHRDAVGILRDAREHFGPSYALNRELRAFAEPRERADPATRGEEVNVTQLRTAWDHYELGRSYLRSGDHAPAAEEFRRSVALQPGEFWPHFFQGICAYRLGHHQECVSELSICVALAPTTAECYYNRAKAYEALGQPESAHADYSRTLELNPAFTDAALNRGILSLRAGRYTQATADLERARATVSEARSLGLICYNLALVHVAQKHWPAAKASLEQAIENGDEAARDLLARLGR